MKLSLVKYILLFCGVIPLLTSCESFLDKQETEDLTFEQLWQKRAYTRGYFLNAMSFLPNDLTGYVSTPCITEYVNVIFLCRMFTVVQILP